MKGREIAERLCRYTVLGLFGAILAVLFALSLFGTSYMGNRQLPSGVLSIEYTSFRWDNPLWGAATLAVFVLGLRLFARVKAKHGGKKFARREEDCRLAMGMQEGDCGPGWYNEYNVKVYTDRRDESISDHHP